MAAASPLEKYSVPLSLLVLAVAASVRFHALDGASLWYDEAVNANNSWADFGTFLAPFTSYGVILLCCAGP